MSKFTSLRGTSAAGRSHQEIALQAVEAARKPVDIDDFIRSRRKGVVSLASNETGHASATNANAALTNNEDDSYMATQENSSASSNPQIAIFESDFRQALLESDCCDCNLSDEQIEHLVQIGAASFESVAAQIKADAARYVYLRDAGLMHADVGLGCWGTDGDYVAFRPTFHIPEPAGLRYDEEDEWTVTDLDAAIDAAIAKAKGGAR